MNIVYTFDDNYSGITIISLYSLLSNNVEVDELNIYIVDCGIKEISKSLLEKIVYDFGRKIFFVEAIDLTKKIPFELPVRYWSTVCYVRLFFSEMLPGVERILHIDCDTIVRGSLNDVYQTDLGNNVCAACYDCLASPKRALGFSKEEAYFSNGFILFDLNKIRKNNYEILFVDYIKNKNGILPHLDQDVISAVLKGKIKTLPPKYNVMSVTLFFKEESCDLFEISEPYYTKEEIVESLDAPIVIHFVGYRYYSRPWTPTCYHPYNKEWYDYYNLVRKKYGEEINFIKLDRNICKKIAILIWYIGSKLSFVRKIQIGLEKSRLKK